MKTAVLTGATGFVGFALLKELIKNNVSVYVLCRPNSKRRSRLDNISGVTVIETDLERAENISEIQSCDVFYHLAWEGERNNFEQQYKNIAVTVNSLKLAARLGCKRFICTGSQAEYGNTKELIKEDAVLLPVTAYGACKTAAYYLTVDLAYRLGIEHTWVRIFSIYGPGDNHNTLIMNLVKDLKKNNNSILTSNGEHIWNYLYEEDAARALFLLGAHHQSTGIYNLAHSECRPLKHFVEETRRIIAPNAVVKYGTEKSAVNLDVSVEKLYNMIGAFTNTSFTDGIRKINTSFKGDC